MGYDVTVRRPDRPTMKYAFQTYDEPTVSAMVVVFFKEIPLLPMISLRILLFLIRSYLTPASLTLKLNGTEILYRHGARTRWTKWISSRSLS